MNLAALILISLALGLLAWAGFVWSVRSGQYEDPEGPKYRMLHDEEEGDGRGAAGPTGDDQSGPHGSP